MRPSLACHALNRYLGQDDNRTHALRSLSLSLYPGQVYSIVGASGCGKSTLLYLLGLLDTPDSGTISIHGNTIHPQDDETRTQLRNEHIGFVYQFHFLLKEFTALENITLPMRRLQKLSYEKQQAQALDLLNAVGLSHKAHRRAHQLSGGEQQRVAIARALANSPTILLADEPTGNLDTENSERIFSLLKQITRERKITLLLVTHNTTIAEGCDITFKMRDGQIIHTENRSQSPDLNLNP
jgi:lipoprotein-releasing system ATP-binding protein